MRMRLVDREVGPIDMIAEDLVNNADGSIMPGDVPLVGIRPGRLQLLAVTVKGMHVEDVLRELVDRIPSRR